MRNIPAFFKLIKKHDPRTEYILSCCSICALCFSCICFGLLVRGYIRFGEAYTGLSLTTGVVVVLLFFTAYITNYKKYIDLSLTILSTTIITICTLTGIWWGFDLPSVLLGYILSIVIMTTVGTGNQNKIHLATILIMMYGGHLYRNFFNITQTWHNENLETNDIIEIFVIFSIITAILVFSQRAQSNLLTRAKRTEHLLKKEKESLEVRIAEKIEEIKFTQIEHISMLYRFVEFGKISSGLFHDLMSPIQTLKLYLESFPKKTLEEKPFLQLQKMQTVSQKIEHMLETMRKQIRFNQLIETFDVLQEIHDILLITKHLYIQKNISIDVICDSDTYLVTTKRVILNHVLLNLISNACEACTTKQEEQKIKIHVGEIRDSLYTTYISIVDTGKGISESNMSKIFDNFYSTKNSHPEEKQSNCGIGLSSSKHAVEHHLKGKLLVESEEHIGTTMTILF